MAKLDFRQLGEAVDLSDPDAVAFGNFVASTPMLWQWTTPSGNLIDVVGAGMIFDNGHATGGGVAAIGFDVNNNGPSATEIQITGLSFPAELLDNSAAQFWRVLEGNDTIIGPTGSVTGGAVTFFGDNIVARPTVTQGGDDIITTGTAQATVMGDVADVGSNEPGAVAINYRGGDDTITSGDGENSLTNLQQLIWGDARNVNASGKLIGGNDRITVMFGAIPGSVAGDAAKVAGLDGAVARFIGGDDDINAGLSSVDSITLIGDAGSIQGFASAKGGNDTIVGGSGKDLMTGDFGNMTNEVTCGDDLLFGADGNDVLVGDVFNAPVGTIFCGDDVLKGGEGSDIVVGDAANIFEDTVQIGGNDQLFGEAGDDVLTGRTGNDLLVGGAGKDLMNGGDGIDIASYEDATAGVRADLAAPAGNTGDALGDTYTGVEGLTGSSRNDRLAGDFGDNRLSGGGGNDRLEGRGGGDLLAGGRGSDVLVGGAGNDFYVFDTKLGTTNVDTIQGFDAPADTIRLDHLVFSELGQDSGKLAAAAFFAVAGGAAHDASDRILYDTATGLISYDADGDGGGVAVAFAVLDGAPDISRFDFTVF